MGTLLKALYRCKKSTSVWNPAARVLAMSFIIVISCGSCDLLGRNSCCWSHKILWWLRCEKIWTWIICTFQCFTDDIVRLWPVTLLNAGSILNRFYHMVISLVVRINTLNINVTVWVKTHLRTSFKLASISRNTIVISQLKKPALPW